MGKAEEKQYFDEAFASSARESVWKYYTLIRICEEDYDQSILSGCKDKRILEYGCGEGSRSFDLAKAGALVHGIDISSVGIDMARQKVSDLGLTKAEFSEMDAENLTFGDDTFDRVCGTGILHHLDLDKSLAEVSRVLVPDGKAVFMEPLGHNPAINAFRNRTPHLRTKDEHPLKAADLKLCRHYFGKVEVRYYALFALLLAPFLNKPGSGGLLKFLQAIDRVVFRILPPLGLLAWYSVITLREPR
ncbi:MAG: class I SAM-dependent methyltransferase [bacterium]